MYAKPYARLRQLLPQLQAEYARGSTAVPALQPHRLHLLRELSAVLGPVSSQRKTPAQLVRLLAERIHTVLVLQTPEWPPKESDCHQLAQRMLHAWEQFQHEQQESTQRESTPKKKAERHRQRKSSKS